MQLGAKVAKLINDKINGEKKWIFHVQFSGIRLKYVVQKQMVYGKKDGQT